MIPGNYLSVESEKEKTWLLQSEKELHLEEEGILYNEREWVIWRSARHCAECRIGRKQTYADVKKALREEGSKQDTFD